MDAADLAAFRANARAALLAERTPAGHWAGELSSSALSTATAVFALSLHGGHADLVRGGLAWLKANRNPDGGWGDTVLSFSNLSTTCLGWAAFSVPEAEGYGDVEKRAGAWITSRIQSPPAAAGGRTLAKAVAASYGKDRTFSVPILTMLALAGRVPWRVVPQLPFELAALPFWCFQVLKLPVVSYALPALIAIGQVRHARRPTWNPLARLLRLAAKRRTLRTLRAIQPSTGGYLEATPLTSFVAMSLIGAGAKDHPVVTEGVRFLEASVRSNGSWPIDTNLTTWVTTLAINALAPQPLPRVGLDVVKEWLLNQQYRAVHPYTRAAPGGWAWTDLPGGVPDADDTPGALLALRVLGNPDERTLSAAAAGVVWLLDLQNRDGGIPTFCKGWTGLPFDRSSNDLTAHTLRAWAAWRDLLPELQRRIDASTARGVAYLLRTQAPDGSWAPLWFGNQHSPDVANLVYGTSRVLKLAGLPGCKALAPALARAAAWLEAAQNADGGWGGRPGTPSSIEETALALDGLLSHDAQRSDPPDRDPVPPDPGGVTAISRGSKTPGTVGERESTPEGSQQDGLAGCAPSGVGGSVDGDIQTGGLRPPANGCDPSGVENQNASIGLMDRRPGVRSDPLDRGLAWLDRATGRGTRFPPSPIGFYFANLWYFERLYPVIFTVAALERVR